MIKIKINVQEGHSYLLNILSCFSRTFHEYQSMFLGKLLAFLGAYCPPMCKIRFVTNKHDCHVCISMLPCILQPTCKMIKSLPPA